MNNAQALGLVIRMEEAWPSEYRKDGTRLLYEEKFLPLEYETMKPVVEWAIETQDRWPPLSILIGEYRERMQVVWTERARLREEQEWEEAKAAFEALPEEVKAEQHRKAEEIKALIRARRLKGGNDGS